jgi:hypothetical protein
MTHKKILILLTIILQFFLLDCSDRVEIPSYGENSTIIYRSKSADGIEASLTFCKGISKKTGKPIKADTVFTINEKAKVYSLVQLSNWKFNKDRELMFHIDWLDSTGNSLYKKRIDFTPSDSSSGFISSISVSPEKRKPGEYQVCLYLFRELIATKYFRLIEPVSISKNDKINDSVSKKKIKSDKKDGNQKTIKPKVTKESLTASIIVCKKISKKTGKPIGVGDKFTIKEKANVKAIVNFEKHEIKTNEQMKFYFNWIGPDEKIFYKKRIVYTTSNPTFSLSNSISIAPEKRKPGIYKIRVVFRKKTVAEQKFELVLPTN